MENIIVETIKRIAAQRVKIIIQGTVKFNQDGKCELEDRGGVYGFAVKLEQNEIKDFFEKHCDPRRLRNNSKTWADWCCLGDGFYPLYWGCDINLGSRLREHTKASRTVGSIQLDRKEYLHGREVIYGAVFCSDRNGVEKELREIYFDIYKNSQLK